MRNFGNFNKRSGSEVIDKSLKRDKQRGKYEDFDKRSAGDHKYNPSYPGTVVELKPGAEFKACPGVDRSGKVLPGEIEGNITWAIPMLSVDFCGLAVPHKEFVDTIVRRQCSMWVLPKDLNKVFPAIDKMTAADDIDEFIINNSPYLRLWNALQNSRRDPEVPNEWFAMTEPKLWAWKCKNDWGFDPGAHKIYGAPLPDPEERVIIRCHLLNLEGQETFEMRTYDDGRQGGALHPAIGELKKSSSEFFRASLNGEREVEISPSMGDLNNKYYFSIKSHKKSLGNSDGSGGTGEYYTHVILVRQHDYKLKEEDAVAEYYPFSSIQQVGEEEREPVLHIMTVKEQLEVLTKVLGPEVIDYAFSNTEFKNFLPEGVEGSYDKIKGSSTSWYHLMQERISKEYDTRVQKKKQGSQQGQTGGKEEPDQGPPEAAKKREFESIDNSTESSAGKEEKGSNATEKDAEKEDNSSSIEELEKEVEEQTASNEEDEDESPEEGEGTEDGKSDPPEYDLEGMFDTLDQSSFAE